MEYPNFEIKKFEKVKAIYDDLRKDFTHNKTIIKSKIYKKDIAQMMVNFDKLWHKICVEFYKKTRFTPERSKNLELLYSKLEEQHGVLKQYIFLARLENC